MQVNYPNTELGSFEVELDSLIQISSPDTERLAHFRQSLSILI
jgi:hypothetical protein